MSRRRRTLPEKPHDPSALTPDPSQIGVVAQVPFVRLPAPDAMFRARAERFRSVAPGHPLESFLLLLAHIADAQHVVQSEIVLAPLPQDALLRVEHGMPPLSSLLLRDDSALPLAIERFLESVHVADAPDEARQAHGLLRAASADERLDFALQIFESSFPFDRLAEVVFVAAALQVYLARRVATLPAKELKPVADGVCPACGGAPVASLVVGWAPVEKARYCACSLCAAEWNYVRIRCTSCGSTKGITYQSIEDQSKALAVETCDECRSYIKHLHQHDDPHLDPVADDIASYALDLLIRERGYRRSGINPLFVSG